jgi:DNA-binding transcriptional MocR family regulator
VGARAAARSRRPRTSRRVGVVAGLNKKIDAFKLRTEAMKHHIAFVPGKIFSSGYNYSNFIRLSFGKPWNSDIDHSLMILGRLIKKMS